MARNSLAHVARGSDGAMFFQWRASRFGAEKFHSAMLPHAGTESWIWREVVSLGRDLGALAPLRGSRVVADIAMLWDWQSWWAQRLEWRPSAELDARERAESWYAAAYDLHLTVDFAQPEAELRGYPLVVVPALYATTETASVNLRRYVEDGGVLVVSCFSGIVDEHDTIHSGPYPGALRDLLGLTVEEFTPLRADEQVRLDSGMTGSVWSEILTPRGAAPLWSYVDGPAVGRPAVTRHPLGRGSAWYVSTCLAADGLDAVLLAASAEAGIVARDLPRDVEVVEREGADGRYIFAINHTEETEMVPVTGTELLTGAAVDGHLMNEAHAEQVLADYQEHYNRHRPHRSRDQRPPDVHEQPCSVQDFEARRLVRTGVLAGVSTSTATSPEPQERLFEPPHGGEARLSLQPFELCTVRFRSAGVVPA